MGRYRVYAPDLPGAPDDSAPHHLNGRKGKPHVWARDLIDALLLERAPHLRKALQRLAAARWETDAYGWGHGTVQPGPHLVADTPIGSHHA